MIKTTVRDGKEYAPVEELFRWDKNPKLVLKDDFERLKRHIKKFGQFKPLVVLSSGEVIGGNSRIEALKDLGIKEAWVSIVNPKDEAEKIEIALADNDEVGKYIEEELALLVTDVDIDLKDYKINVGKDIDLERLLETLGPSANPEEDKETQDHDDEDNTDKFVTCPECGHKFSVLKEVKNDKK